MAQCLFERVVGFQYKNAAAVTGWRRMAKARKASRRASGGLTKWFKEDWRDISTKDKSGKHEVWTQVRPEEQARLPQVCTSFQSHIDVCLSEASGYRS